MRYLKPFDKYKGLLKESENTLNNIWNQLKRTLGETSISDGEKQRILDLIENGQGGYAKLTKTQREQLYKQSVDHLKNLEQQKKQTADYLKQKQQQEKEGKEFVTQKTPKGVELKWMGDNYEIYFPNNEVEKQTLNFGTNLGFAKYVFDLVKEYEKEEEALIHNPKVLQEEIYDTLYTMIPSLERIFKKTISQNN